MSKKFKKISQKGVPLSRPVLCSGGVGVLGLEHASPSCTAYTIGCRRSGNRTMVVALCCSSVREYRIAGQLKYRHTKPLNY